MKIVSENMQNNLRVTRLVSKIQVILNSESRIVEIALALMGKVQENSIFAKLKQGSLDRFSLN